MVQGGSTEPPPPTLNQSGLSSKGQSQIEISEQLRLASSAGDIETVSKLLAKGASVNAKDENGYSALQKASCEGRTEIVKQLIRHNANVDQQDDLHGNTSLHEAAWKGFSDTAEQLVKAKANVYIKNRGGFAPLHLACQNGHNQSCRVILLAGCQPDIKNNYGDTPLHTSARYGHAGVTRILLSARANVKEMNKNGDTTLHIATAMGRRKLTRILLEAGADQFVKNKQGETPSDIAQRKEFPQILEILKNPPPVVLPEERLRQEQEKKIKEMKEKKNKKREKTNDSGTSSKESGSRPKEKKKLKSDTKLDAHTKTSRKSSWGVEWSPYGCPYSSTLSEFLIPKLDSLPQNPLDTGEQYFVDLAGNIKKGPVGVGSSCYCAPLFKTVQHRMEKDKMELIDHIDAAHVKLGQRISSLESHTKNHIQKLGHTVQQKLAAEKNECRQRTEKLKLNREEEVNKKVEELQQWVRKKLSRHHPDSPPTFRGRTFGSVSRKSSRRDPITGLFPLTRSRSEEAVSEMKDDSAVDEPVYKGLRVLDHPTSMYNIPQSVNVDTESFIYNFNTTIDACQREDLSGDRFRIADLELSGVISEESSDFDRSRLLSTQDNCNLRRQNYLFGESRRRDPLPPLMCSGVTSPHFERCPSPTNYVAKAVSNLNVCDGEVPSGDVTPDKMASFIPQVQFSKYEFRKSNPYMHDLRSKTGQKTPYRNDPYETHLSNAHVYNVAVDRTAEEPVDAATYIDMGSRYQIEASVKKIYDGYRTDTATEGIGSSIGMRSFLESSTEHDSHNDSGYSTKMCTISQGFPDTQDKNILYSLRQSAPPVTHQIRSPIISSHHPLQSVPESPYNRSMYGQVREEVDRQLIPETFPTNVQIGLPNCMSPRSNQHSTTPLLTVREPSLV